MSEELVLDAVRFGVILGIGIGIVAALVGREVREGFKEWRRSLERDREIRCMKRDWK